MCGIVGYIGQQDAYPIVIKGLKRLEYRGYDSAGVAINSGNNVNVYKRKGKVSDLEQFTLNKDISGCIGMGHTRWATHGIPNDVNAHPHISMNGKFVIIHNGIIENYAYLKKKMIARHYEFKSETDTEVLANLIEYIYMFGNVSAEVAVRLALTKVIGAYGLVVMCIDEPDKLIAARNSSPLVIGLGQKEYFIASDATPFVEYTDQVVYLDNQNVAIISRDGIQIKTIKNDIVNPDIKKIDIDINEIEKGGFNDYMLKEIYEQPKSITDTMRGRVFQNDNYISLGGLLDVMPRLMNARRVIIVGCGTSWHAGLVGEYLFEEYARVPVEVEYASEFRYRNPIINSEDVVIAISQSGETADTLAAIQLAKKCGACVIGICNVVGSTLSRETDAGVYTHAGPEIGVASTKAFTTQVTVLAMMALMIGKNKFNIKQEQYHELLSELISIPTKIEHTLQSASKIEEVARLYKDSSNFLYLGRGCYYPVALEGALKLKEISYIHAEGYPAAEMKHGPIALIDDKMPVVVIATKDKGYEKIVNNIQEVKARKGIVIAVVSEGDQTIASMADHVLEVPVFNTAIGAILTIIPLQLLSYYIAIFRGCNVDQPRNLAKSVTVE
ncbi:MAG: glutamine--fructose-6-phosphate transaminase (isomerizing) [Bacteroidales bacterium]|nr:glutamine--fructose-6-phosphate transaminase (isomerizing) [Bacteroidales bacterium]